MYTCLNRQGVFSISSKTKILWNISKYNEENEPSCNAERFLRREQSKTQLYFSALLLVFSLFYLEGTFKREIQAGFGYLSDMCWTRTNSLKPPWTFRCFYLAKYQWPCQLSLPISLLPCSAAGPVRCPFLAWTSFPKAPYYYFSCSLKCLLQFQPLPAQSELWKHRTRQLPSWPCSPRPGMKVLPAPSLSLPLSLTHFPVFN